MFRLMSVGQCELESPRSFKLYLGSFCSMTFVSKYKETNTVALSQGPYDAPSLIIRSPESNAFYCVYDFDVDWQLIKIHLKKPYKPLPKDNPLCEIVLQSDCEIERITRGGVSDWNSAAETVARMSPSEFRKQSLGYRFLFPRIGQKQLVTALHSFGGQGQYPGDIVVQKW